MKLFFFFYFPIRYSSGQTTQRIRKIHKDIVEYKQRTIMVGISTIIIMIALRAREVEGERVRERDQGEDSDDDYGYWRSHSWIGLGVVCSQLRCHTWNIHVKIDVWRRSINLKRLRSLEILLFCPSLVCGAHTHTHTICGKCIVQKHRLCIVHDVVAQCASCACAIHCVQNCSFHFQVPKIFAKKKGATK